MSMQCLKIQSLCVFGTKLGKGLMNLVFIPVFKPHAHKLYISIHQDLFLWVSLKCVQCNLPFYKMGVGEMWILTISSP
jgi:hypothetical protein